MRSNQRMLAAVGVTISGVLLLAGFSRFVSPSPAEAEVIQIGKAVAGELMAALKKALTQAMQEGGPAAAVQVCKVEAPLLAERISATHPEVEVRRTSLKFRNPKNRPDSVDERVLEELSRSKDSGDSLPEFSIRKVTSGGETTYRFYQPILVSGFCLNCHGRTNAMPAEVTDVLRREYPEDQAVGYLTGDLRGVILVKIPARILADQ